MDQVALGKRIKTARERAGMTQEDLAAAVDYSVDHMSVVERGVKAPKLDKLVTIANVLKVGTDELLQDNLDVATLLHATELSERLKTLSPEGQRKVRMCWILWSTNCGNTGAEVCLFADLCFFRLRSTILP